MVKDGTAMLRARLKAMYPGEVENLFVLPYGFFAASYDLAISRHQIVIAFDRWGILRNFLTTVANEMGWRCFHYTSTALTTKAALDLACVEIGAAYGVQEGERARR